MSNAVFPSLPGVRMAMDWQPGFRTRVAESVSGLEIRSSDMAYPKHRFKLSFEVLRAGALAELQQIGGFFLARRGSWDSFLISHPDDNAVTDQLFGVRDGVKTEFQLVRTFGAGGHTFTEPVQNVTAITNVKSNGVAIANPADYTVDTLGAITLAAAGTNGHSLTWSGTYYYRARFAQDEAEYTRFLYQLYEQKTIEIIAAPGNKV